MLLKLALRNIFRQRIRSVVTLVAIVFGVVGLILSGGFVKDIFVQLGEAIIQSETGHVQVFREGFREKGSRQPDRYLIDDPAPLAARIANTPQVRDVSSRLSFSGLLNNGKRDLAIVGEGVEPEKEARLGSFLKMVSGRPLSDADAFGMIVGQGVAQSLALKVGDQVTLLVNTAGGALNTVDLEVVGIFQSFSRDFDARALRIPLAAAQELLATAGANQLVVTLHHTRDTDAALATIQTQLAGSGLEAFSWKQLSDFYEKTLQLYDRQFGVLQVIILVMVLLSVANTVNMSAFERLGESLYAATATDHGLMSVALPPETLIPANEGIAFPLGTMDTFVTYGAPANLIETVNTMGLPIYARQIARLDGSAIDVKTEASPLPINKRPRLAVKITTSN